MSHVVYWLYDDACFDPSKHGYVGMTKNYVIRLRQHKRRFAFSFKSLIIFTGSAKECRCFEYELRSVRNVGWNLAAGGGKSHKGMTMPDSAKKKISEFNKGKIMSEEAKRKMSEAKIGKPRSEETKQKLRNANLGKIYSDETRQKQAASRRGRSMSEKTRQALLESNHRKRGKTLSEEHKKKISKANKGKNINRVFSEETKCKMSEAAKNRKQKVIENETWWIVP